MEELTGVKQTLPEDLKALQKQLERGEPNDIELPFGNKVFVLRRRHFEGISLYGSAIFELIRLFQRLITPIERK